MPYIDTSELRLHYLIEGREDAPWLILSNSLGTSLEMWAPQMPALLQHFRVLRYDTRGHGQSGIPAGPYTIDQLGSDVIALMDGLGIARAHFCGLSMGGMIGIWLGIHQPSRFDSLALCNTSPRIGTAEVWNARIDKVNSEGMQSIVPALIERWFTPAFQLRAPQQVEQVCRMLLGTDPSGYTANCAAVRDMDQRDGVLTIKVRTLVIAGKHDQVTPTVDGRKLADDIPGACFVELDAAHLSNWEAAEDFTEALLDFLNQGHRMDERERHAKGMEVRRAVLGNAHVDRAQGNLNPLNSEFQDLITRYAWGEIWTRPGLPRHTRSLLTIMAMVALNREEELKLHLRAAANNGVTRDEIKEVLLQAAIYCGVPAANSAFHMAQEVFRQVGEAG